VLGLVPKDHYRRRLRISSDGILSVQHPVGDRRVFSILDSPSFQVYLDNDNNAIVLTGRDQLVRTMANFISPVPPALTRSESVSRWRVFDSSHAKAGGLIAHFVPTRHTIPLITIVYDSDKRLSRAMSEKALDVCTFAEFARDGAHDTSKPCDEHIPNLKWLVSLTPQWLSLETIQLLSVRRRGPASKPLRLEVSGGERLFDQRSTRTVSYGPDTATWPWEVRSLIHRQSASAAGAESR
jgi:hypothetical protein